MERSSYSLGVNQFADITLEEYKCKNVKKECIYIFT